MTPASPAADLLARWRTLGAALGHRPGHPTLAWEREGRRLLRSWSRWPRAYHDTTHLLACLRHLDAVQQHLAAPATAALALWYHDAIYWPWSQHNEERSAAWARRFLSAQGLPAAQVDAVAQLVMDTRHAPGPLTGDACWVVDIDLAVLGQDAAVYVAFERNVRREYFFVRWPRYQAGRSAVLRGFLDRPRIYGTDHFAARYEAPARANLQRALDALAAGRLYTAG